MTRLSRRNFLAAGITGAATLASGAAFAQSSPTPTPNIDDFFRDFTADWVRHNPSQATRTRYFAGDEQDRLERQLTPQTLAWQRDRIQRARQGLADLHKFNRASLTEPRRISTTHFRWSK